MVAQWYKKMLEELEKIKESEYYPGGSVRKPLQAATFKKWDATQYINDKKEHPRKLGERFVSPNEKSAREFVKHNYERELKESPHFDVKEVK